MQAGERYVVGLDSSTQSVKAIAWTREGVPRAEGRAKHQILQPSPRRAEQDAEGWWTAAGTALRALAESVDPARIDGIAISNQRETMVLLGENGHPLAPATLWLDQRAHEFVPVLADELGARRLHEISGKPVDVLPCVYRLRYLRETDPALLERTAQILSVHDFLVRKLAGKAAASWTSADPFGLFDIRTKQWSQDILDHLGIPLSQLPSLHRPGSKIGEVTPDAFERTGLLPGTPIFAAGGDGHCAGLGVGVLEPGTVYLNLGTALVGGVWSETPEISQSWRTLVSPDGHGYLLESVQRSGAFFINWLLDTFAGGRADPAIFTQLEAEANDLPVGSGGVMVSPYLLGCMDPHWDQSARATFTGLGAETAMAHLYRASLEAVTLEFVRSLMEMRRKGVNAERIFVIGGGAESRLWLRMIADASGLPVVRSLSNEASALGAGMSAAVGAGWYDGFREASQAMRQHAEQVDPRVALFEEWQALSRRQARIYPALAAIEEDVSAI